MDGRSPTADLRLTLLAQIDPLARAARVVLLLDERQPDALRAEAITMRPERLFWTLSQLDGGLPQELCQALVRAVRLTRRRQPVTDTAEALSAALASTAAADWLRGRWSAIAAMTPLDWLGARTSEPERPLATVAGWLAGPPVLGPLPGAVPLPPPGLCDLAWLAAVVADGVADVLRSLAARR